MSARKRCEVCGTMVPASDDRCKECGAVLQEAQEVQEFEAVLLTRYMMRRAKAAGPDDLPVVKMSTVPITEYMWGMNAAAVVITGQFVEHFKLGSEFQDLVGRLWGATLPHLLAQKPTELASALLLSKRPRLRSSSPPSP